MQARKTYIDNADVRGLLSISRESARKIITILRNELVDEGYEAPPLGKIQTIMFCERIGITLNECLNAIKNSECILYRKRDIAILREVSEQTAADHIKKLREKYERNYIVLPEASITKKFYCERNLLKLSDCETTLKLMKGA